MINSDKPKQLNDNLLRFFTGFIRFSSDMQKVDEVGYSDKIVQLKEMLALVNEAEKELADNHSDLDKFDICWTLHGG